MSEFHVLNGDALKYNWPSALGDQLIIFRECLVDGPIASDSIQKFWKTRQSFMTSNYDVSSIDYLEKSQNEIMKIVDLKPGDHLNLWFEDDLFCQINLWACLWILKQKAISVNLFLIRPNHENWIGFGSMNNSDLEDAYNSKVSIGKLEHDKLAELFEDYTSNNIAKMRSKTRDLRKLLPRLEDVINAHSYGVDAFIKSLYFQNNSLDFPDFFKLFHAKGGIYGLGDSQVKRIWKSLKK